MAHVLNMFLYLLGLLPLTHLVVTLRPTMNITETGEHIIKMVPVSFIEVRMMVMIRMTDEALCYTVEVTSEICAYMVQGQSLSQPQPIFTLSFPSKVCSCPSAW